MTNHVRWRIGALASAVALVGSLTSLDVHALALGRITVQSALGEPLRAEVDILEISADEAGSLKAAVAGPEAFKFAGLDYSAAVVGLQISLQKRADGRSYLRVSSNRPVTEPFVDLVLDTSWSSGRIVRDYTMLFDPPALRQSGVAAAPAAPVVPLLSRPAPSMPGAGSANARPPVAAQAPARPAPVVRAPTAKTAPTSTVQADRQSVQVRQGDTASKIAAQNKPNSISLDQMLLALLASNPEAFAGGNINRLKAGAVLAIPGTDEAGVIPTGEASRAIVAQARDFNEFRRKLAEGVPATQVGNANRQAAGKLEAKVEDRAPATATPDKLTLSKGAVQSKAAAEDKIVKDRQAAQASSRVAELSKNISDLNKLSSGPAAAAASSAAIGGLATVKPGALPSVVAAPPASVVASPSINASAPKTARTTAPPLTAASDAGRQATPAATAPTVAASAATASNIATLAALPAASAPTLTASAPAAAASQVAAASGVASAPTQAIVKKSAATPLAPPQASLVSQLTENPFVLPGIASLLLLLAGFGFYRYKNRNNGAQVDSSFLESRLQRDSFFGSSGGQRIDTSEDGATGSSLVYSPSQLDAAGDVDPVAEADVYLAYGRDLQAEEILKEAMRTSPTRVAIHAKLMEIYAKRRDVKAFEVVAMEAFSLTRGEGPDWAYIGEMGRELDATNPMYQPGGRPQVTGSSEAPDSHFEVSAFGSSTLTQMADARYETPATAVDFDLDLDFSTGDAPEPGAAPALKSQPAALLNSSYEVAPIAAVKAAQEPTFDGLELDFLPTTAALKPSLQQPTHTAQIDNGLDFTTAAPAVAEPASAAAEPTQDNGMLEFDLGSLSLELDPPIIENSGSTTPVSDDPLETKFALAEEFRALGDMDGARALAEEVAAQSDGSLKNKARAFLNALA